MNEDGEKVIYTNAVNVSMSQFDFVLDVCYRQGREVESQVKIVTSPQHYKALIHILTENLKRYEELFGPINLELNQETLNRLKDKGLIKEMPNGRKK